MTVLLVAAKLGLSATHVVLLIRARRLSAFVRAYLAGVAVAFAGLAWWGVAAGLLPGVVALGGMGLAGAGVAAGTGVIPRLRRAALINPPTVTGSGLPPNVFPPVGAPPQVAMYSRPVPSETTLPPHFTQPAQGSA